NKAVEPPQLRRSQFGEGEVDTGRVALRPGEADDEAERDRIISHREHDRKGRSGRLRGQGRCGAPGRDDQADLLAYQLSRHLRQPVVSTLGKAIFDRNATSFDVAGSGQTLAENSQVRRTRRSRARAQITYDRHLRLLRTRRERPRGGRAAQTADEVSTSEQTAQHVFSTLPVSVINTVSPRSVLVLGLS